MWARSLPVGPEQDLLVAYLRCLRDKRYREDAERAAENRAVGP